MITDADLKEYLSSLGVSLPDSMVSAIVIKVNTVVDCMESNGYPETDIDMALKIAGGLIAVSMGAKMVSSQSADVVSQSYKYQTIEDVQSMLTNSLSLFDPNGCTNSVIPSKLNPSWFMAGVAQYGSN